MWSLRHEPGGGNVSRAWPRTRRGAGCASLRRCASSTCVRGRGRDPWPRGSRRRNTRPAHIASPARARSIRDDRRRLPEVFLLRDHTPARRRAPWAALPGLRSFPTPSDGVAAVPPRHAAGVLPGRLGVSAAAWPPANGAASPDIQVLGSNVGCTAAPEISGRSLCRGKCAIPADALWHAHGVRWYAELVPWEVMTPWGSPRRMDFILLGHFALDPLSLPGAIAQPPWSRFPGEIGRRNQRRRARRYSRANCNAPKETGRRLSRNGFGPKGEAGKRLSQPWQPPARNRRRLSARAQLAPMMARSGFGTLPPVRISLH